MNTLTFSKKAASRRLSVGSAAWLNSRVLLALRTLFAFALIISANQAQADNPGPALRILHVMSFDSPWRWTDGQFTGFRAGLGDLNVQYEVFQMDIKRYATQEEMMLRGEMARSLIRSWLPDLVYISDDAGIEHVAAHYQNHELPFVFSGANKSVAEHGLESMRNLTGVLEHEHFAESIRLLRNIAPWVRRIAVISDYGSHWGPVIQRIRDRMSELEDVELVLVDQVGRFEEFRHKVLAYPEVADAVVFLGVFGLVGDDEQTVPYQTVQRWVVENSALPDVSFWIDRIHFGVLASVTVSEIEQGLAVGKLARAILLEGKAPDSLPVNPTVKGRPAINLARALQLGISVQSTELLSSEVVTSFEWQRTGE